MNASERAFPVIAELRNQTVWQQGMLLRDYFAAKAMQGMVINQWEDIGTETIARNAYDMADAMLKARDK